jgi:hypothetical protein
MYLYIFYVLYDNDITNAAYRNVEPYKELVCLLTVGFELGITCSLKMVYWRRNMSEQYM